MVTDYYGHAEVVCSEGDLRKAIAASAAIPAVFRPVMLDGIIMIDGGIFNPVPFDQLAGLADIVIGVDVVGLPSGVPGQPPTTIDMMFGASQLMMQSIIEMKRQRPSAADSAPPRGAPVPRARFPQGQGDPCRLRGRCRAAQARP
jgi:NTE family protein